MNMFGTGYFVLYREVKMYNVKVSYIHIRRLGKGIVELL